MGILLTVEDNFKRGNYKNASDSKIMSYCESFDIEVSYRAQAEHVIS